MGWQDRHYYRDQGSSSNWLMWIFNGSAPLFTAFGIRVRMHSWFLILIVIELVTSGMPGGMGVTNAMTLSLVLFTVVLLHEFGHCFAGRWVGGEANDILLWPLGGLAYVDAPNRPLPQLITAVGGPAVNVIICLVTMGLSWAINLGHPHVQWNPLTQNFDYPALLTVNYYLWFIFTISWALFLFNLLPVFPLDGGRILEALLWFKLGKYRASMIAAVVGIVGAALMVMYGLTAFWTWYGVFLIWIGVSCGWYCLQMRAQLKAAGPWEFQDEGANYGASLWHAEETKKHKKLSRWAMRRLRRQAQADETEQARIDAILAKVSAHGMHSLTWVERRVLRKATERQRRRELELSRER